MTISGPDGIAREFLPAGDDVTIYVCGITPYDSAHLGHVATFLVYDVLTRRLLELGRRPKVIRNITDLDDPILPRALKLGVSYDDLVESEIRQFGRDMRALGMLPPFAEPRVSQMLDEIRTFIAELEHARYTYLVDGVVYYDVSRSRHFASLADMSDDLRRHRARQRGGDPDNPVKRNPYDFVLWRPSRPGEPSHPSRWGPGMPGWHIGCSAMLRTLAGPSVDLHGGGSDLLFPHHECEQAQSMALQPEPFVRTWHHCQFVRYRGAKMSKSVGNIVLARDLLERHDPRAVRLALLRLYRHTAGMEWRDRDTVAGERLLELLLAAAAAPGGPDPAAWAVQVRAAIDDNLDFPTAVAELEHLARAVLAGGDEPAGPAAVVELAGLLGVDLRLGVGGTT